MNRLVIVSNRLPITIHKKRDELIVQDSIGGLATGLGSIYRSYPSLWIGWPGLTTKEITRAERKNLHTLLKERDCEPVYLSEHEYEQYYNGFCNRAIWPLFHYFYHYAQYDQDLWNAYVKVNRKFCNTVCASIRPGDVIWVHDYHLMLLPQMIREKNPDATIGFFLHIPFPPFELFRLIPWRKELLSGLLGADLVGFHTIEYVNYFLSCIRRILGHEHEIMRIRTKSRIIQADTFPMGIDFDRFSQMGESPSVKKEINKIHKDVRNRKVILSIDRLDYTKGVPLRLKAFEALLKNHPELKEKVTMILVAVPSRSHIDQYAELKHEVDHLVGHINGLFGTMSWIPVRYMYTFLPYDRLIAIYKIADIALITPVRDGMNLMAKEYLATKKDEPGILILSEFAGAAKELGEAILVNPNDIKEFSSAIYDALMIPEEEQKNRIKIMQTRLSRYNLARWTSDFLEILEKAKQYQSFLSARWMDDRALSDLCTAYLNAQSRVIFLDYDGTLVPIAKTPIEAKPDPNLFHILEILARDPNNNLVIISGREKSLLTTWFGSYNLGLVAEHGIWIREAGGKWEMNLVATNEWKDEIRSIIEVYVDRTPGSFIEEKEYSLAWHYRNVDPSLAAIRIIDLREDLLMRTKNLNLTLLEGHKVLEIKNIEINKGSAVNHWIKKNYYDFILAIGDDRTDEDIFKTLPHGSYSIKVGPLPSIASYSVRSVEEVRNLLQECFTEKKA
ncbi:MAG: bifunctional alpha,alpha-trehalose-phosphate synthase (UDP-forming)/trehalose-phosphatase [Methanomicrobiales archaeon]|nr:bifunctional alpha,alpha-trehalose-phosphate synthase (UDP-forming)/trehalose-phosphatase [Methanomicrobiales archaeon]